MRYDFYAGCFRGRDLRLPNTPLGDLYPTTDIESVNLPPQPLAGRKLANESPFQAASGEKPGELEIRRLREQKNWSQSDFARELQLAGWDVERSVITKIELRRRCITDYELLLMLRTLDVPLSSLKSPKPSDITECF